jgi:hypothetical protein
MRLYSTTGAASVQHDGVRYEPADDGGFDFPDALSDHLHGFHDDGKPMWETHAERHARFIAEELERRKDPATLLAAVEQLGQVGYPSPARIPPASAA